MPPRMAIASPFLAEAEGRAAVAVGFGGGRVLVLRRFLKIRSHES